MICTNLHYICMISLIVSFLAIKLVIMVLNDLDTRSRFEYFMVKYNKTYSKERPAEYHKRYRHFEDSIDKIERLNSLRRHKHSAVYGITEFSDLSSEEFALRMLSKRKRANHVHTKSQRMEREIFADGLPESINWIDRGVVSPIRNQGTCGACWAHSVIETIESMWAIARNASVRDLSVQQMVDCAVNNHGCSGGDTCGLLYWLVVRNVPIVPMRFYPTTNSQAACDEGAIESTNTDYTLVKSFTCESMVHREHRLLEYLANIGPVTVGINALSWQYYLGGIIQHHCDGNPNAINHAVQIVGYDRSGEVPFYIVRNSWGENFGDRGFAKVEIGSNLCGIATQVSAIIVK